MCGPFSSVSVCMRFKGMGDEKFQGILVVQDPAGRTVDYFQGFDSKMDLTGERPVSMTGAVRVTRTIWFWNHWKADYPYDEETAKKRKAKACFQIVLYWTENPRLNLCVV